MVKSVIPHHLKDALELLSKERYKIVAGGTDMLILHHNRSPLPIRFKENIMYVANIPELKKISEDEEALYIGSSVTLTDVYENEKTPQILKDAIIEMASPAIRNTATLAGNIANASPAGDSLVPLYLLNADIEIKSSNNTRIVCIRDFIQGVRKIDLKENELITNVIIEKTKFTKAVFKKIGTRRSDAISKLSFAGAITIKDNKITDFRITFGSVNTTVVRRPEIECNYILNEVTEFKKDVEDILLQYEQYIKPINDQRSNKTYRKQVCLNLLKNFILEV